jgi:signal transduction histidine kinase
MIRRYTIAAMLAAGLALPAVSGALAQEEERASPEEARAMLDQAVEHYEEVGREQAIADFNEPEGDFRDRDLYVFCVGPDDTMIAHPSVVGMDVTTLTDAEGQEIGNEIIRIGREEGGGTLDYRWENPTTGEVEDKSTYIEPVGDDVVCAVGYYQE